MRCITIDRMDDGRFRVRIMTGIAGDRSRCFVDREEAARFAKSQMGRKGMVIDTTLMTPDQRAEQRERERRAEAVLRNIRQNQKQ